MRVRVAVVLLFFSPSCLPAIFLAGLHMECKQHHPSRGITGFLIESSVIDQLRKEYEKYD